MHVVTKIYDLDLKNKTKLLKNSTLSSRNDAVMALSLSTYLGRALDTKVPWDTKMDMLPAPGSHRIGFYARHTSVNAYEMSQAFSKRRN